jgi:hypothetical protein
VLEKFREQFNNINLDAGRIGTWKSLENNLDGFLAAGAFFQ